MLRWIRTRTYLLLTALTRALPGGRTPVTRPVLLVLRPDAIGDYILFRPWLRWLREASPWADWHIVLVGNLVWGDLANEFDPDCFDEVLWMDRRKLMQSPLYFFAVARRLRRLRPALLVYPVVSREILGDLLVRASRAGQAIAAECDGINLEPRFARRSDRWYTRLVPVASRGFEFYRTGEFFSGLCDCPRKDFPVDTRMVLADQGWQSNESDTVCIFPGAGDPRRRWPVESWSRVAGFCIALGYRVAVCGSSGERALCQEIAARAGGESLAGALGWKALVECVSRARLVVCHDSMALHLAAACGAPVVCISNGNHYGRFVPYPDSLLKAPMRPLFPPCVHAETDPEFVFAHGSDEDISGVCFEEVQQTISAVLEREK